MPDVYTNTGTTNFDKTIVPLIIKQLQENLRAGTKYTPPGSVLPAQLVKGTNATFRSVAIPDLAEDGAVSIEDGQADPDVEDLGVDYIEFTGTAKARTVGLTDNAQERSPFNLQATAVERVSRDIAVSVDNVARAIYAAETPVLFGGTANTNVAGVAAGDKMTAGLLKDAVAFLRGFDVKPLASGLYAFVAHPFVIRDLQADSAYIEEQKYADPKTFMSGQVGVYAGAAVMDAGSRGIILEGDGTSGIDVYLGTLIGAQAIFAALAGLKVIPVFGPDKADPLGRRDLVSWKGILGGVKNDIGTERFLNIGVATTLGA
jgi:N4-gp56 family major capsid protein